MSDPYIAATGLDAAYPASDSLVLQSLNLSVAEGEIVALVGPNGSGKSTLLRALGRILKPKGGAVMLDTARKVLRVDFPELAARVDLLMPSEKDKRHGQAIAAASLPSRVHAPVLDSAHV